MIYIIEQEGKWKIDFKFLILFIICLSLFSIAPSLIEKIIISISAVYSLFNIIQFDD